jgi:hypothetical protein
MGLLKTSAFIRSSNLLTAYLREEAAASTFSDHRRRCCQSDDGSRGSGERDIGRTKIARLTNPHMTKALQTSSASRLMDRRRRLRDLRDETRL